MPGSASGSGSPREPSRSTCTASSRSSACPRPAKTTAACLPLSPFLMSIRPTSCTRAGLIDGGERPSDRRRRQLDLRQKANRRTGLDQVRVLAFVVSRDQDQVWQRSLTWLVTQPACQVESALPGQVYVDQRDVWPQFGDLPDCLGSGPSAPDD